MRFCSEQTDRLRQRGHSKDPHPDKVQVALGLAQTTEGLHLGYTLHAGDTADVLTLSPLLETLPSQGLCPPGCWGFRNE